jgi:hypothetical protein
MPKWSISVDTGRRCPKGTVREYSEIGLQGAAANSVSVPCCPIDISKVEEAAQREKNPTALTNGEQLVFLLMKYGFGVYRSMNELFEFDEELIERGEPENA